MCRDYAYGQSGGGAGAQAATNNAVGTAVVGTALGAGAGAALGSLSGRAGAGAVVGGTMGALMGGSAAYGGAQMSAADLQRRYDMGYTQCMVATANRYRARPEAIDCGVTPVSDIGIGGMNAEALCQIRRVPGPDEIATSFVVSISKQCGNVIMRCGPRCRTRGFICRQSQSRARDHRRATRTGHQFRPRQSGRDRTLRRRRHRAVAVLFRQHHQARVHIADAHQLGVSMFAFDSPGEMRKLARAAPGADVFCRIAVPGHHAEWPLSRKFGCAAAMAPDLLIEARDLGLHPVGV